MKVIANIKRIQNHLEVSSKLYLSRKKAHLLRNKVSDVKEVPIVDRQKIKFLKKYSKEHFKTSSYWPYLALYTEIRGEFNVGWLPYDYYWAVLLKKINPDYARRISDLKTFDFRLFPNFSLKPLFVKISGVYYDCYQDPVNTNDLRRQLLSYNKEIVVKEDRGMSGNKVKFMFPDNNNVDSLMNMQDLIIQPVINQHETLNKLNKSSVNSMRIITYMQGDGNVELKFVCLKFGIGNMRIDNTSAGGGFCPIKESGFLEADGYNYLGLTIGKKHPISLIRFNEVRVPALDITIKKCKEAHKSFPYVRIVGWDVAIGKEGTPILLEWNTKPLIWLAEALKGPLFENEMKDLL